MIVRPARTLQASIVILVALIAASCTEKLVEPPAAPTVFAVPDSIQQVFTQNCAFDGCHGSVNTQQGQNLSDAVTSYANIVGIASHEKPAFLRIAPGDSANSYMAGKRTKTAIIYPFLVSEHTKQRFS